MGVGLHQSGHPNWHAFPVVQREDCRQDVADGQPEGPTAVLRGRRLGTFQSEGAAGAQDVHWVHVRWSVVPVEIGQRVVLRQPSGSVASRELAALAGRGLVR